MSYKWSVGDWARVNVAAAWRAIQLDKSHIAQGEFYAAGCRYLLSDCIPIIVRDKPQPKRIKRSELRSWFDRQDSPNVWTCLAHGKVCAYVVSVTGSKHHEAPTFEKAILELRKALRKAGKFTP